MENMRYAGRSLLGYVNAKDVQIPIYDWFYINTFEFKIKRKPTIHIVSKNDVRMPHQIIIENYGTYEYEDIIWLLNNIENPMNLRIGIKLILPDPEDIKDFLYEQNFLKQ